MPVPSPFRSVEIPNVTVYDLIFGSLSPQDAGRTAITDSATGTKISFGDLRAQIDLFAGALAHRGISLGDVVALHAPNSLAFAIAFHGIMRAGATVTTVGALGTAQDIAKQLSNSEARLLLTVSALGTA